MVDNYITGASGFIGSHLLKRLEGDTVCIPHLKLFPSNFQFLFKKFFFLSTYGNMADQDVFDRIIQANILDLWHVLRQSALFNTSKFIFTSTSSVNLPKQTVYSRSKKAAEEILLSFADFGHHMIIIRPYSVTGVGEQKEHLIPKLIHSCFSGEEMPFAPDATHDWIDVEDVVDGMLLLSEKAERGIYELGNGFCRTNKFVRGVVEAVTGHKANCVPWEGRAYDNAEWFCKDLAVRQLGWYPKRTLLDSIEGMVEDYLKNEPAKTVAT